MPLSKEELIRQLGGFLESAILNYRDREQVGLGGLADSLFEAVVIVDDLYTIDGKESRFKRAREALLDWTGKGPTKGGK